MFVILSGEVAITQHDELGGRDRHRHARSGLVHGRAGPALGPPVAGRCATRSSRSRRSSSRRTGCATCSSQEAELGERIMRALILRRVGLLESGVGGPVIVGPRGRRRRAAARRASSRATGIRTSVLDPDSDSVREDADRALPRRAAAAADRALPERPAAAQPERGRARALHRPGAADRSDEGSTTWPSSAPGPAGLAAAVYAASEGLVGARARLPRLRRPGGRLGADRELPRLSRPASSGMALMARAYNQAQKFGAEMAIPDEVVRLRVRRDAARRALPARARERRARARAHGGDRERRPLPPPRRRQPRRSSRARRVHYWASPLEARLCAGQEVALVGAGNSAGQAAVYLAEPGREGLAARARPQPRGEHVALPGRPHRGAAERRGADADRGHRARRAGRRCSRRSAGAHRATRRGDARARSAISSSSSAPSRTPTGSRSRDVALDDKGFVRTGAELGGGRRPLETSRAGVFAIGDVRAGSVKRVAAAVGEGAQVVATLHAFLAQPAITPPRPRSPGALMADECTHAAADPRRDAERARLRGVPEDRLALGAPAALPDVRPRRLLRQLAEPPRHQALPRDRPSDHRGLRPARGLGLVLRRRGDARPRRARHAAATARSRASTEISPDVRKRLGRQAVRAAASCRPQARPCARRQRSRRRHQPRRLCRLSLPPLPAAALDICAENALARL